MALATAFAYWCLPQLCFYCLYTLLGQVLNAHSRFGAFMWAPALANVVAPVVEVHISDIHAREEFRRFSYITDVAAHVIVGRGTDGYLEAIDWLAARRG